MSELLQSTPERLPVATGEQTYEDDTISLLDLIGVLVRRKWLILVTTIVAAVGILAFSVVSLVLPPEKSPLPNSYTALAEVLITEDSGTSLQSVLGGSNLAGLAGLAGIAGGSSSSNGELALSLLKSRTILDQIVADFDIIAKFEIEESPITGSRAALLAMTQAEMDAATGILSVSVEYIDPVFARDLANRYVEILNDRFQSLGIDQTTSRVRLLEEKITEVDAVIARLEDEVEAFQRQYGTFNVQSLIEEQVAIRGRIRSDLILKEIEISTYEDFSTINDPALIRLQAERDNLRQLLNEMDQGYSEFTAGLPSQQELPELATRFARLEREAQVQAQIYATLRQQYELAQLALQGEERTFQILEYAEAPDRKSGPSRAMISIITTITAFFLSVFLAFVLEYFARVKDDPEENRKLTEIKKGLSLQRASNHRTH